MSRSETSPGPPGTRRAYRSTEGALVAGVAAGLADHLGVPVRWVRVGFVVANVFSFLGLLTYAGLWMVLPAQHFTVDAPGLDSASRGGRRRGRRTRLADHGVTIAIAAVTIGVLALVGQLVGGVFVAWPVALVGLGVAVLWWQADEAQRERWRDSSGRVSPLRAVVGAGTTSSYARVVVGVVLVVAGLMVFALRTGSWATSVGVGVGTLVSLLGLAIVLGPLLFRLTSDLSEERAERIRSHERADLAAHLHDSVLQTLALIQKSAGDPSAVTRLARAQERDLRSWLFTSPAAEGMLATVLRELGAAVDDSYGVPVEVVCVGDRAMGPGDEPVVQATREAVVNAVKHSGAPRVDVYAEVSPEAVEVFVRDRGRGFELDAVGTDRHGVRESIVGRMRRHGGRAEVRTRPGEGTEVHLVSVARGSADG